MSPISAFPRTTLPDRSITDSRLSRLIPQPPDKLRSIVFRSPQTRHFTTCLITDQAPSIGRYSLVRLPLVLRPARYLAQPCARTRLLATRRRNCGLLSLRGQLSGER